MNISDDGLARLIAREGCVLTAYRDAVGVWTIGVGHSADAPTPPYPVPGMTITQAEAETILRADLAAFEGPMNAAIKRRPTQRQWDAMVSLAFNIGIGGFLRSTVLRKFNLGDDAGAADAFLMWASPPVLRSRRIAERAQFLEASSAAVSRSPAHAAAAGGAIIVAASAAVKPGSLPSVAGGSPIMFAAMIGAALIGAAIVLYIRAHSAGQRAASLARAAKIPPPSISKMEGDGKVPLTLQTKGA